MKRSICHYSFQRCWKAENWSADRLASEVSSLGVEGVDFHAGLLGSPKEAPATIQAALQKSGRVLSGISLSNNFNQEDTIAFRQQIETVKEWIIVASVVKAPVCRIFGGDMPDSDNSGEFSAGRQRVLNALAEVVREAEKYGLVLALENHGGLPCTAEEQVQMIEDIGSESLRATIDVGNYMQGGQEGHVGTEIAAKYAAYVHFKDFRKVPNSPKPWGWDIEACTLGRGDVNLCACLDALREQGYDGFVALEYEGPDDETIGVPESIKLMNEIM